MNHKHQEIFDKLNEFANELGFLKYEDAGQEYLPIFLKKTKEYFENKDFENDKQIDELFRILKYVLVPLGGVAFIFTFYTIYEIF